MKVFLITILCLSSIGLLGCSSGSKDLDVIIKHDNLCFFTNDSKSNYYDSKNELLIYMSKAERKADIKTEFERTYKNRPLPIEEADCLEIPLAHFKKEVVYSVVLDIKPTYATEICVKNKDNQLVVKKIEAGEPVNNFV